MKILSKVLCVAMFVAPVSVMAADDMGCDSVNWGQEVLAKFPNAQKGCQGVTMKNGEAYAHYIAEIVKTDGDTVTVHLLDKEKKGLSEVQFVPNANQKITVNGKETKYQDLKKGTKLDLYIQHNRWGLYSDPASTPMAIVSRKDL